MHRILSEEGIQFVLSAEPFTVQGRSGEGVSLAVSTPVGAQTIEASDILIAIGRIPNTTGIGVDAGRHIGRARLYTSQRPSGDNGAGCLSNWRMCRYPAVHACLGR